MPRWIQPTRLASLGLAIAVMANVAEIVSLATGGVDVFKLVAVAITMFALGFCLAVWVLLPIMRP